MLFDPAQLVTSTLPAVTELANYMALPIYSVGFTAAVIVTSIAVAYYWFVVRLTKNSTNAILKR